MPRSKGGYIDYAETARYEKQKKYAKYRANELDAIAIMLDAAKEAGLLAQVVMTFAEMLRDGDIKTACAAALYEWDI